MRELSLFSGAGGGLLGTKLLGWETIGYVEFNDYCQRVLKQRILDGIFDKAPIFSDIRVFISEGYAESYKGMVDVITAGFPCQPFSVAGKGLGVDDPRNMWQSTKDCISIIQPEYCFLENVPGLLAHGYIRRIFGDLAEMGYDAKWGTFPASAFGYGHERERFFIIAYSHEYRLEMFSKQCRKAEKVYNPPSNSSPSYFTAKRVYGLPDCKSIRRGDGVANRSHRVKAAGNGQCSTVVEKAWKILTGS